MNKPIIPSPPTNGKNSPLPLGGAGGGPKNPTCRYCSAEANPFTNPPLCPKHEDIAVLIGFLQGHGLPVTPESLTEAYQRAAARGGDWTITETDIPKMLTDLLVRPTPVKSIDPAEAEFDS